MKVGLLFDRECQPAWIVAAVRKLQQDPDIHIDYVVILSQETKEPAYSQQHWLYRLYQRIDARLMAYLPDSWSLHNIGRLFTTEQVTTLAPDSLANPLTNKWAANPPEIALYFGESLIDRNRLLMLLPHYGILTLLTEQGTSLYSTAKWAVFSKAKTASAAVWQLADDPADDRLLALTTVAAHRFSVRWTEHVLFNKATELLRYQLFAVVQGEERPPSTLISQQANIQILPISLALMRLAVRFFASIIYDVIMPGRWILAIRSGGSPLLDDLDTNPLTRLKPPVGFQWADPFLWEWQNQRYIFFEEIPPTGNKAHISVVELTEHDAINFPAAIAICQDYHMSYPFLFSWQGTLFMMPQTTGNKSIEIYRCTKFPQEWVLEKQFFEA